MQHCSYLGCPLDIAQETVKCPECQKPFATKSAMKTHFISVHEGLLTYKERQNKYNVHEGKMTLSDIAQETVKCPECHKPFATKSTMKAHFISVHKERKNRYNVHEGKKPFKCSRCEEGFTSIQDLQEHFESVH